MKFAIAFPADQTIVYLADAKKFPFEENMDFWWDLDNDWYLTVKHSKARLFDNRQEVQAVVDIFLVMEEAECWIEEIADKSEFHNRPNTW